MNPARRISWPETALITGAIGAVCQPMRAPWAWHQSWTAATIITTGPRSTPGSPRTCTRPWAWRARLPPGWAWAAPTPPSPRCSPYRPSPPSPTNSRTTIITITTTTITRTKGSRGTSAGASPWWGTIGVWPRWTISTLPTTRTWPAWDRAYRPCLDPDCAAFTTPSRGCRPTRTRGHHARREDAHTQRIRGTPPRDVGSTREQHMSASSASMVPINGLHHHPHAHLNAQGHGQVLGSTREQNHSSAPGSQLNNGSSSGQMEEVNTKEVAQRITTELKRYSIPQAIFARGCCAARKGRFRTCSGTLSLEQAQVWPGNLPQDVEMVAGAWVPENVRAQARRWENNR